MATLLPLNRQIIDAIRKSDSSGVVGPYSVDIDICERCHNRCLLCPDHGPGAVPSTRERTMMPRAAWIPLLDGLARLGTVDVNLVGSGEPLLHPDLEEIIARIRSLGMRSRLTTGGLELTEERLAALVSAGLDKICLSLWAASSEVYACLHPGLAADVFSRLRELVACAASQAGLEVWTNNVICSENWHELPAMAELAAASRIDMFLCNIPRLFAATECYALTGDMVARLRTLLPAVCERLDACGIVHNTDCFLEPFTWPGTEARCYMGYYSCIIDTHGHVALCPNSSRPAGCAATEPIERIWRGEGYRSFRAAGLRGIDDAALTEYRCGHCPCGTINVGISRALQEAYR